MGWRSRRCFPETRLRRKTFSRGSCLRRRNRRPLRLRVTQRTPGPSIQPWYPGLIFIWGESLISKEIAARPWRSIRPPSTWTGRPNRPAWPLSVALIRPTARGLRLLETLRRNPSLSQAARSMRATEEKRRESLVASLCREDTNAENTAASCAAEMSCSGCRRRLLGAVVGVLIEQQNGHRHVRRVSKSGRGRT